MKLETLKQLEGQAGFPRGVAARVESEDLAVLLVERALLLRALTDLLAASQLPGFPSYLTRAAHAQEQAHAVLTRATT